MAHRLANVTMSNSVPIESSTPRGVAVVVTVYNKSLYVRACIESVLAQSYAPIDFVIVDDGSTDGSWEVVQSAAVGSGATLLRLSNGGVSKARNLGFRACRTRPKYLLFLDADDVLQPDALQRMVTHMDQHGTAAMCYSVPMLIDEAGTVLGIDADQVRWAPTKFGRRRMPDTEVDTPIEVIWSRFRAMPSACLVRCSSYEKTNGWDESLCRPARPFQAEDKDMAIQLALTGLIHRLETPTVKYRVLPTAHRQALYEGLLAVDRKWWNASLGTEARRRIRRAIRFDSLVVMLDAVSELRIALCSGSFRETVAANRKLMRVTIRWAGLPVRLRKRSAT
jgi:glycosyltransferase involved in cell wall biosynthesis